MDFSPLDLAQMVSPTIQRPPHLKLLESFILKILRHPGRARAIIQMPVRHGKSWYLSRFLTAWYSLLWPDHQIIVTGYGQDFASEWGRAARDIVAKIGPSLCGLNVDPRLARADHWAIAGSDGGLRTCGTLGPISGKGAHLLISDDQIKDQQQANSPTYRDSVHSWFMADCLSRLEPSGKVIVVLSRRHPDDLVGRLLSASDEWQVLRMSALCDDPDTDPLHRPMDSALWPERYDKPTLLKIKSELELSGQSHIWECLYQQNPQGDPSAREWPVDYFEGIWTTHIPQDNVRFRVLALDPSKSKRSTTGDYSAFVYAVLTHDGHFHVQSWLVRVPLDQLVSMSVKLLAELKPDGFIVETVMMQALLAHSIQEACKAQQVPCPIWEFCSHEDKIVRIRVALTPLLGGRRLHLDESSPGNRLLLSQLREFPTCSHDDGPDSLTMACYLLNQMMFGRRQPEKLVLTT